METDQCQDHCQNGKGAVKTYFYISEYKAGLFSKGANKCLCRKHDDDGVCGSPERYDRPVRHDHMICRECGRLSDITLQDMTKEIEESTGVCIESYDLKIYYICEECRKK